MHFTKRNKMAFLFCVCAWQLATAQEPATVEPAETIRVDVQRVNVGVIVTGARGLFIRGLKREDFHAFDNNIEQSITEFSTVDEPAQVLLLVEAGPAVYFLQDAHIFAADAMLQGLAPSDQVAIARYDIEPAPILPFTNNKAVAQQLLRYSLQSGLQPIEFVVKPQHCPRLAGESSRQENHRSAFYWGGHQSAAGDSICAVPSANGRRQTPLCFRQRSPTQRQEREQ